VDLPPGIAQVLVVRRLRDVGAQDRSHHRAADDDAVEADRDGESRAVAPGTPAAHRETELVHLFVSDRLVDVSAEE
jgi:hypothetical protein